MEQLSRSFGFYKFEVPVGGGVLLQGFILGSGFNVLALTFILNKGGLYEPRTTCQ